VAVSESEVLVADAGNRCVHRFALNGDFIAEVGRRDPAQQVPGIIVPSPHLNCAWSAAGEIWVNNPGRHQVERYDRDGRRLGGWGAPGFAPAQFVGCCNPTNLALLGGGADGVVVSEKGIPRIKVYSEQGQLLAYLGPELFSPKADGLALATDTQGRIYALDAPAAKVLVFAEVEPAAAEPSL
jgi:hypothetical protein